MKVDSWHIMTKMNLEKALQCLCPVKSFFYLGGSSISLKCMPSPQWGLNEINRQSLVARTVLLMRESHGPKAEGVALGMMGKVA